MSKVGPAVVLAAIVCDDMRKEDNGKELLIGVYSDRVILDRFPQVMQLSFWLQFKCEEVDEVNLLLQIVDDNGTLFGRTGGDLRRPADGVEIFSVGVTGVSFPLSTETKLHLELTVNGSEWTRVRTVAVVKAEPVDDKAMSIND